MRHHVLRLLRLWLIRQLTYLPLAVLLFIGFRSGAQAMTPEDRWHPAFMAAGLPALAVLAALGMGWLPFNAMALGMLLFILVGCVGIIGLAHGFTAIHLVYTPMAQAMLFVWIGVVFAALTVWQPLRLLDVPPATPRLRLGALALVGLAGVATCASWWLRAHEALAGLLPFLGLMGAKWGVQSCLLRGRRDEKQAV